jgi:hypothetical protein
MPVNATAYYPYASGAGANVTEAQWREFTRFMMPNAALRGYLNGLNPFGDSTGLQVKVDSGAAWNYGAYGEWNSTPNTLAIAAVSGMTGAQERWDRIVCRNDFVNKFMTLDVLTGTPQASGAGEVAGLPALTQSASMWEIPLASVGPLTNVTTTITVAMVLDRRIEGSLSGPGLPSLYHLQEIFVKTSVASVTFSNIPQTYDHLALILTVVGDQAGATAGIVRANGDTTANYNQANIVSGNPPTGGSTTGTTSPDEFTLPATGATLDEAGIMFFGNYARIGRTKSAVSLVGGQDLATAGGSAVRVKSWNWNNATTGITSLTLLAAAGNIVAGSVFSLYGIG